MMKRTRRERIRIVIRRSGHDRQRDVGLMILLGKHHIRYKASFSGDF